jgi:hypothetical protein
MVYENIQTQNNSEPYHYYWLLNFEQINKRLLNFEQINKRLLNFDRINKRLIDGIGLSKLVDLSMF